MIRVSIAWILGLALAFAFSRTAAGQTPPPKAAPEAAEPKKTSPPPNLPLEGPPAAIPTEPTHTSATVAGAPPPHQADNRSVEPSRDGEWALWIPRVLLFPVRVVGEVAIAPIRWGLYGYEKYSLGPRVKGIFFNEDGTVGVYPTALIETGFGFNVGGRLILRRLYRDTGLTARAGFGGRFEQIYSTKISTKDTFKRFELEIEGVFESRPKDRFYGVGNADLIEQAPSMPLDPLGPDAVESHFSQDAIRIAVAAAYKFRPRLRLKASTTIVDRSFEDADDEDEDEQIANNYDAAALTGFADGTQTLYSELELTYDSRRASNRWEGDSTPSIGWLAQVYAGYTLGLGDDPARYIRYGLDIQRYFRLGDGPRTLALRGYLEGVTGSRDEVSFYDLPRLGGPLLLRGYDQDRFRDRVAGLGTAEYQFDAVEFLSGFVFADVGRVYSDVDELELNGMRLGFGGGLEAHTKGSYLGRLTMATSTEGGFFLTVSFDPVYDVRARVERK